MQNLHKSFDGSVLFFFLFTIFMRAAKGPFHATIWEQPLTAGVGPMGASCLSLVVVGMREGRSITTGLAAVRLVVLWAPALQGGLSDSTSAWETPAEQLCTKLLRSVSVCVCVCVCVRPGCFGAKVLCCNCLAPEWVETEDNITPLIKHCLD